MNYKNHVLALAAAALAACAHIPELDEPQAAPAKVHFYAVDGQSPEQQDRDRYDCFVWAVGETDFDPSRRIALRELRATVVPSAGPIQADAPAQETRAVNASYSGGGYGRYEREAAEYRRAISACLQGRGYSVR